MIRGLEYKANYCRKSGVETYPGGIIEMDYAAEGLAHGDEPLSYGIQSLDGHSREKVST